VSNSPKSTLLSPISPQYYALISILCTSCKLNSGSKSSLSVKSKQSAILSPVLVVASLPLSSLMSLLSTSDSLTSVLFTVRFRARRRQSSIVKGAVRF
jgi:hypothetical protein